MRLQLNTWYMTDEDDLIEREDADHPDGPEECPKCGSADLTPLYRSVTQSVSEFAEWSCDDCDWSDAPPWTCNSRDTNDGEPCGVHVSAPGERCHYHPEDGDPKISQGAPEGNDNAVNNDGGAPEGNTNRKTGGHYQSLERRLETMDEDQKRRFRIHYRNFLQKAENKGAAIMLATAEVLCESVADRLIRADKEGDLWEEIPVTNDQGEPIVDPETGEYVKRERLRRDDIQALKSLMTELRLGKKYEGINDNQDASTQSHGNAALLWDEDEAADLADHEVVPDEGGV